MNSNENRHYLPHSGHRKRMRSRFVDSGMSFSSWQPHEVLEVMLYLCHRRCNTNPVAHRLYDRFGSVGGALDAPPEKLLEIPGVGVETAARFAFWSELFKYCEK